MTIRTHAATDDYRTGWDAVFGGPAEPKSVKPTELDIARVYCKRLLPVLPANPESHVAIPLWALRALVGEQ